MSRYSRQDVLRILHLHTSHLTAWERAGLISTGEQYTFEQLGQLRMLRDLRARRMSARSIRASLDAMQRVVGMPNALREVSAVGHGSRLTFRHGGALLDPVTQQLSFDFDDPTGRMRTVQPPRATMLRQAMDVQEMFQRAVQREETAAGVDEAIAIYELILEMRPAHAPTLINLGTIHYNRKGYAEAEGLYRRATMADPGYALAFFDLGNVLDEMQRMEEATAAYQKAVTLVPQYADAHYNLALSYERQGQRRRALRHWLMYVRLDPAGPWSAHARGQAKKILKTEKLSIVSRRGRLVQAG